MRVNSRVHQDQFSPSSSNSLHVLFCSRTLWNFLSLLFASVRRVLSQMNGNGLQSSHFLSVSFFPFTSSLFLSPFFSFRFVSRLLVPRFFLSCLSCLAHSLIVRVLLYSMNSSILSMTRTRTEL